MSNPNDTDPLLTDRDVAKLLRVSVGHVRNGHLNIPFIKFGRAKRTRLSDVRKLIEASTVTKRSVKRPDGTVEEIDLVSGARTPVQET